MDYPEALALINIVVFSAAAAMNGLWSWRGWRRRLDIGLVMIPTAVTLISIWSALSYGLILANGHLFQVNVTMLRPAMLMIGLVFLAAPSYLHTVRQALGHADEIREMLSDARRCQERLAQAEKRLVDLEQANNVLMDAYQTLKKAGKR
jgi:hypothetical protein